MGESPVPVRTTWSSAAILLHSTSSQELADTVEAFGAIKEPVLRGWMWFYPSRSRCDLDMHVIDDIPDYEMDLEIEAYAQWWKPLTDALGQEPQTALCIHVREQDSAQESVRKLISHILAVHPSICGMQGMDIETGAHVQFVVLPRE